MRQERLTQIEKQLAKEPTATYKILANGGQIGDYLKLAQELLRAMKAAHKKRK